MLRRWSVLGERVDWFFYKGVFMKTVALFLAIFFCMEVNAGEVVRSCPNGKCNLSKVVKRPVQSKCANGKCKIRK